MFLDEKIKIASAKTIQKQITTFGLTDRVIEIHSLDFYVNELLLNPKVKNYPGRNISRTVTIKKTAFFTIR